MARASSASSRDLAVQDALVLAVAALLGAGAYLLASALTYRVGFPLDDSWIHATYARNLALHGEWAFQLGHLSAGSTAPLWTILLVPGFWLRLEPLWWSYFLGVLAILALAMLAEAAARRLVETYRPGWPWVGLFFVGEWHMLWAALSGMETILQALVTTAVLVLLMLGSRRYLGIGLLAGLSVWIRPDGLTLLLPVLLAILIAKVSWRSRWRAAALFLIGFGALLLPYLLLNLWLSGTPLPNTFYAKQAEYAAWQARPFFYRAAISTLQLLTGPSVLLVPGLVAWLIESIKHRKAPALIAGAWCIVYVLLYALRLPAYQHGRYLMPAMPVLFLLGLVGYLDFTQKSVLGGLQQHVLRVWRWALVLLTAGFVFLGARAYAQDVGLIETEMVNTAHWVAQNLPPNSVLAAHDIGALGYFDHHRLIDLAGLVSPQVVPIIRDEPRLAQFMDEQAVNYLIAFPVFYPDLEKMAKPVYSSGGEFAPAMGQPNLTVYCWSCQ